MSGNSVGTLIGVFIAGAIFFSFIGLSIFTVIGNESSARRGTAECREAAQVLGREWEFRRHDGCYVAVDFYWHKIDSGLVLEEVN